MESDRKLVICVIVDIKEVLAGHKGEVAGDPTANLDSPWKSFIFTSSSEVLEENLADQSRPKAAQHQGVFQLRPLF